MTVNKDLKKRIRQRQAKTGESYTTARAHVLRARDALNAKQNSEPRQITAIVQKCGETSLRALELEQQDAITLRCSSSDAYNIAPGQLIEVEIDKRWIWGGNPYASGSIKRVWTDVSALGLEPLSLEDTGICDLVKTFEPYPPDDPYHKMWQFFCSVPRHDFVFDGIAWGAGVGVDPDDHSACLVADAAELVDRSLARELLMDALMADLRCIDAHVHLGNLKFDLFPERAIVHYDIAVKIGELSLDPDFDAMLLWGHIYNRPFLRALHAYGLCLWRLEQLQKARSVFERILSLNPPDNQGVRFCWGAIRNDRSWSSFVDSDVAGVGEHSLHH